MVKTIYLLLVLSLISFSCTTTGTTKGSLVAKSKYPQYTLSQARLKFNLGECEVVSGAISERDMQLAIGRSIVNYGVRVYEPENGNMVELYSAIDSYIELDEANAFVLYEAYGKYAFTTMTCSE